MRDTFPDWRGETVLVLGAGESAKLVADVLRPGSVRVIAINRSFELMPWAEVLYGADAGFWMAYPDARKFAGWKFAADQHARRIDAGIVPVTIARDPRTRAHRMEMVRGPVGTVGSGANSGFQAVNLAAQFGASRILLCLDYRGDHWHGDHVRSLRNPTPDQLRTWARWLDQQARVLASWGIEVISVAKNSTLKAYPYADCSLFNSDECSLPT